jgi:hypothetical protein
MPACRFARHAGRPEMAKSTKGKSDSWPGMKPSRKPFGKSKKAGVAERFATPNGSDAVVLDRLFGVVESRRDADPTISHSARLLSRGPAKVAQKFGEEAVECLIEAVAGNRPDRRECRCALPSAGALGILRGRRVRRLG